MAKPNVNIQPGVYIWVRNADDKNFFSAKVILIHYDRENDRTYYQVESGADANYSWPVSVNVNVHIISEDDVYGDTTVSVLPDPS